MYRGDTEIAKHKQLIHDTYDITLTEQEFENFTEEYDRQIMNGPGTPKRLLAEKEWNKGEEEIWRKKKSKEKDRRNQTKDNRRKEEEKGRRKLKYFVNCFV